MPQMNTAVAAVETLIRNGIDTVYGVPGIHNDPLFDALYNASDRIRVMNPRHEQTAGYMALGAALATGKPQVFSVVPGPGFLNASSAVLTANSMFAPVLALVGQIPQADIDRGLNHLHEIRDQVGLARHLTKSAARIRNAGEAPGLINDAIRTMMSGRRGPAMLECAIDVWGKPGAAEIPDAASGWVPPVDLDAVRKAAAVLAEAKRPMIFVGRGAQHASAEVIALAEKLGAPVCAYRGGLGVMPPNHPLMVNLPQAHRLWREADVALSIGSRMLYPLAMWGDSGVKLVRVDIDPEEPERLRRPAASVVADAVDACVALVRELPEVRGAEEPEVRLAPHRAWLSERLSRLEPQMSYLAAMRAGLPEDGILVEDVTQLGFAGRLAFPVAKPGTYLSAGLQDNLGWCFGTALGVKAAKPNVPVVAMVGDGGFLYQSNELATAVQHGIGVVVVLFDNGGYENVKRIQQENYGGRLIACDLVNPDFLKLADAFGVAGYRANSPAELTDAMKKAIAADKPALIHVPVGSMPSPWDMILMPRIRG